MRVFPPYGDLWKVAVVDESRLSPDQRTEVHAWVRTVIEPAGIPLDRVRPRFVVTENSEDRRLLLHLTVMAHDSRGMVYIDHAADRVHSEPYVFQITDYPAWLPAVSQQQGE